MLLSSGSIANSSSSNSFPTIFSALLLDSIVESAGALSVLSNTKKSSSEASTLGVDSIDDASDPFLLTLVLTSNSS